MFLGLHRGVKNRIVHAGFLISRNVLLARRVIVVVILSIVVLGAFLSIASELRGLSSDYGLMTLKLGYLFISLGLLIFALVQFNKTLEKIVLVLLIILAFIIEFSWGIINPYALILIVVVDQYIPLILPGWRSLVLSCCLYTIYILVGALQGWNLLVYDSSWLSADIAILDVLFVAVFFLIQKVLSVISMITLSMQSKIIHTQAKDVRIQNIHLKTQIIRQTRKILQHSSNLDSVALLQEAFNKLHHQEQERFLKTSLLANYSVLSYGILHNLANQLMLFLHNISKKLKPRDYAIVNREIKAIVQIVQSAKSVFSQRRVIGEFVVGDIIKEVVAIFDHQARKAEIKVEVLVQNNFVLNGDVSKFYQILVNLLKNALESCQAVQNSSNRTISVIVKSDGDIGTIRVRNCLKEKLSDEVLAHMFDMFFSTKDDGGGIGLYISRKFIREEFKGDIRARISHKRQYFIVFDLEFKGINHF